MPGMLWCSASQNLLYPERSTCWARSRLLASACPAVPPSVMGARSSTLSGGSAVGFFEDMLGEVMIGCLPGFEQLID